MTFPTLIDHYSVGGIQAPDVPLPVSIQSGDVVIVYYAYQAGTIDWDDTTAGIWTLIHDDGNFYGIQIYARVCDGSESNLTLAIGGTSGSVRAIVHQWRGPDLSSIYCTANGAANGAGNPDPPSLNPDGTSKDTFWIAGAIGSKNINSYPGSFSTNGHIANTGTTCIGVGTFSSTATSINPGTFGADLGCQYSAFTLGVRVATVQNLAPSLFSEAITFYGPIAVNVITPDVFNETLTYYAATVTQDQVLAPPLLTETITYYGPTILKDAIGPPLFNENITYYSPTVQLGTQILQPPLLSEVLDYDVDPDMRTRVIGGTRTVQSFNRVRVGPFSYNAGFGDAAMGDLAIYNVASEGQNFASRWETRGPIGYYDFVPFAPGTYTFQDAYAWLRLEVADTSLHYAINIAKVNVDVPDVVDSGTVAVSSGGSTINFTRSFYAVPKVVANVVTASGVNTVPRCTVRDDVTKTGFHVTIHYGDDLTNTLAGTIHYVATGY